MNVSLRLLLLALAAPTSLFAQTTWYVDITAPGPGDGTLADPYPLISDAVGAAATVDGDTILVAAGTYFDSFSLQGKSIRIVGAPGPRPLVRGDGTFRYCSMQSGEGPGTEIANLEFAFGRADSSGAYGGAMTVYDSTVLVTNCVFRQNIACASGGAVHVADGDATFVDCVFTENRARYGGAILVGSGVLRLSGCSFDGNSTVMQGTPCGGSPEFGGAIRSETSSLLVEDCTFSDNEADRGGAIDVNQFGVTEIRDSAFLGNRSFTSGGGAQVAEVVIENTTFEGNTAATYGGAVGHVYGTGTVRRCVFIGNTAVNAAGIGNAEVEDSLFLDNQATTLVSSPSYAGTAYNCVLRRCVAVGNFCLTAPGFAAASDLVQCTVVGNVGGASATAANAGTVDSCIVWGNRTPFPGQSHAQLAGATVFHSLVEGHANGVAGPPLFLDFAGGDLRLLPGSPAIDAGSPLLPADPDGSPADIGALPFDPTARVDAAVYCAGKVTSTGCVPAASLFGLPRATGAPARFQVTGVPSGAPVLMLAGTSAAARGGFFGGTLCLGDPLVRSEVELAVPASGCGDAVEFEVGPAILAQLGAQAGDLVFLRAWFRDVAQPDGTGVGLSDAVVATVQN